MNFPGACRHVLKGSTSCRIAGSCGSEYSHVSRHSARVTGATGCHIVAVMSESIYSQTGNTSSFGRGGRAVSNHAISMTMFFVEKSRLT